jgi:hypothetical protein
MTIILASRFIAATNAPTTTRRNTATEPRFKREDCYSFRDTGAVAPQAVVWSVNGTACQAGHW